MKITGIIIETNNNQHPSFRPHLADRTMTVAILSTNALARAMEIVLPWPQDSELKCGDTIEISLALLARPASLASA